MYREGQEDQLAALGLVLNAVVLWNTRYLDAAITQLRAEGHDIKDENVVCRVPTALDQSEPLQPIHQGSGPSRVQSLCSPSRSS